MSVVRQSVASVQRCHKAVGNRFFISVNFLGSRSYVHIRRRSCILKRRSRLGMGGTPTVEVRQIGKDDEQGLLVKNEPFTIFGELLVKRSNEKWDYEVKKYGQDEISQQTFPDEDYNFEEVTKDGFAIGAFESDQTVGLAIFKEQWHQYIYLEDLKVNGQYRRRGVAQALLAAAEEVAKSKNYKGFWTIGQNNNLAACLFYVKYGFEIGGLETKVYDYTTQSGKYDIHFYYDFD